MNRKLKIALTGLMACFLPVLAVAALFPSFPIVGGAAYCSSYTGSAGTTCTNTVPAGPTAITGNEKIAADTYLSGGRAPQTVLMSMAAIHANPFTYVTLTPGLTTQSYGASTTMNGYEGIVILGSAALTGTVTGVLPSAPMDGQQFAISSNQSISTLTLSGGSATVSNTPVALTVATTGGPYGYQFRYRSSNTTWYRLQ